MRTSTGSVVHRREVWYINGKCGTSTGSVVHQREVWYINGKCGTSTGSVVHQREVCVHPRCTHTFPFDMPTQHATYIHVPCTYTYVYCVTNLIVIEEHLELLYTDTQVSLVELVRNVPPESTELPSLLDKSVEETQREQQLPPFILHWSRKVEEE